MSWPDGERIDGIDVPLPPGETIRWQGSPDWRSLALHAFHVRAIALYFGLLIIFRGLLALGSEAPVPFFAAGAVPLAVLGAVACGISAGLAWLTGRTARYAITDRRLVMRIGMVLPSVVNIPLRQIESAAVKRYPDQTGDLAVRLTGTDRIGYLHLWPHARGWRVNRPEPAFRSVTDPDLVSATLEASVRAIGIPGDTEPSAASRESARTGMAGVPDLVHTS